MAKKIAVIPARSGSTRVPDKNIYPFFGKPLLGYAIEACQKTNLFDRIIVSTDSQKYADIAIQYGVEMPFLRTQYYDNFCVVSEATLFAVKQAEEYYHEEYDIIVQVMANCPIRDDIDILNAYNNFITHQYESQISCFKYGFMNPWWAFKLNDDHKGEKLFDTQSKRSQDLGTLYCPTGAIWICQKQHLIKYNSFYGNHHFFEMNWKHAVDIDNYEDLELAQAIYLMQQKDNENRD